MSDSQLLYGSARRRELEVLVADFDRTLVQLFDDDSLDELYDSLRAIYARSGVANDLLNPRTDPYSLWFGCYRWLESQADAEPHRRMHLEATRELEEHERRAARAASLLPTVLDGLRLLNRVGVVCAIVSSNSQAAIEIALDRTNCRDFFRVVIGRHQDDRLEDLKPSPQPLLTALEKLNSSAKNSAYIGDSRNDALAAAAAGLFPIGILTGHRSEEELRSAGAELVLPDFASVSQVFVEGGGKEGLQSRRDR